MNSNNPLQEQSLFLHAMFRSKSEIKQNKTLILLLKITRDLAVAITMLLSSIGVRTRVQYVRFYHSLKKKICVTKQDGFLAFKNVCKFVRRIFKQF